MPRKKQEKTPGELDPVSERLMEFVGQKGGPSPVAGRLGKHPQLFYNIRDGASKPSMDTLREMRLAFADFDLEWIIMGTVPELSEAQVVAVDSKSQVQVVDADRAKLMQQVAVLSRENQMYKSENERLWRLALPEAVQKELDFLRSSSQYHRLDRESQEVYGLVRYQPKAESRHCKVLPLNSLVGEAMRILNSRAEVKQQA